MRLEINPTHTCRITHTHISTHFLPFSVQASHTSTHPHPIHSPSGGDSIVKWCTVARHQIIVHHIAARGLIALSIEHRQKERQGAGREGEKRMDTETERTFDKIAWIASAVNHPASWKEMCDRLGVCVCVCVWVCEREREGESNRKRKREGRLRWWETGEETKRERERVQL